MMIRDVIPAARNHGLTVALLVVSGVLPWSLPAWAEEDAAALIGTWKLVSVVTSGADGSVDSAPYGTDPVGYINYTSDGFMSAVLMFSGRERLAGNGRSATPEELAAAFSTSLAYAGTYTVENGEVTHHVEVAMNPNRVGTSAVRSIGWNEGMLTLTPPDYEIEGVTKSTTLTWRKVSR